MDLVRIKNVIFEMGYAPNNDNVAPKINNAHELRRLTEVIYAITNFYISKRSAVYLAKIVSDAEKGKLTVDGAYIHLGFYLKANFAAAIKHNQHWALTARQIYRSRDYKGLTGKALPEYKYIEVYYPSPHNN